MKKRLLAVFAAASIGFMAGSITSGSAEDIPQEANAQFQAMRQNPPLKLQKAPALKEDLRRVDLLLKYLAPNPNTDPATIENLVNRKVNIERLLAPKGPCPCPPPVKKDNPQIIKKMRPDAGEPLPPMKFSLSIPGFPDAITGVIEQSFN